jgi:hypothetical protein
MATFSVEILPEAEAEFLTVPFPFRRQLNQLVFKLMANPKLQGSELLDEGSYRMTSNGLTILYEVDEQRRRLRIAGFRQATPANEPTG